MGRRYNYGCFGIYKNNIILEIHQEKDCLKDVLKDHVNDDECITY